MGDGGGGVGTTGGGVVAGGGWLTTTVKQAEVDDPEAAWTATADTTLQIKLPLVAVALTLAVKTVAMGLGLWPTTSFTILKLLPLPALPPVHDTGCKRLLNVSVNLKLVAKESATVF